MKDRKLILIDDAARGLACECVCVSCGRPLIAKKGAIRRHYFSHIEVTDCRGNAETVLHLLSKELLSELESVEIPPYEFVRQRKTKVGTLIRHEARVAKGGLVPVHGVKVEEHANGFIPDIIIESASKFLIVEVAVSHKVNREKLRRIRKSDLPAIEIRLNASDSFLSRDLLREKLQTDLASKLWLFHPAQREAERVFLSKWRDAIAHNRKWKAMQRPRMVTPATLRFKFLSPTQPRLTEYDRTANEFRAIHGRYPTVEECLELWPHLWKP